MPAACQLMKTVLLSAGETAQAAAGFCPPDGAGLHYRLQSAVPGVQAETNVTWSY